jgi:hypothetical protein
VNSRVSVRKCAWFIRIVVAVLVGVFASIGAVAQVSSEGIGVMAREKSLAEQFLVILNDFGRKDISEYAIGVTRYAEAKAEFDGLIAELEHELGQPEPPNQSEAFEAALKAAVDKRIAFTSFVTNTILPQTGSTHKGIAGDFIKGGGELIRALTDAGVTIWREFRSVGEVRRNEIRQELETLRWPQFSVAGAKPD